MDNALYYAATNMRAPAQSVAFLQADFVNEQAVWIIENIPQETIIHLEPVAEIRCRNRCIPHLASQICLKRAYNVREHTFLEVVADDKQIYLRLKYAGKMSRECDEPKRARTFQGRKD